MFIPIACRDSSDMYVSEIQTFLREESAVDILGPFRIDAEKKDRKKEYWNIGIFFKERMQRRKWMMEWVKWKWLHFSCLRLSFSEWPRAVINIIIEGDVKWSSQNGRWPRTDYEVTHTFFFVYQ